MAITDFKNELAAYLGISSENIFLFWKGRVALYAILKCLGIREGDEVILPAFTCVVVPNAVIYLGAKPVYADIDPKTYNIDIAKVEEKITPKTKVILAQNTFGLSPDMDPLISLAAKNNLNLIEDCAHGFGGSYKGKPNGTIADASFFSTQWNKPFSTGLGGMAVTKNTDLANKLKLFEEEVIKPSRKEELVLKSLIYSKDVLANPALYWKIVKAYRYLSNNNIVIGSSRSEELEEPHMPKKFVKGFSTTQAKRGSKELKIINKNLEHRVKLAECYHQALKDCDLPHLYEPSYAHHTYLRYPLLVSNRNRFMEEAMRKNIEVGDWFISPIHPIKDKFEKWDYDWGSNPVAERICQQIINLPTHQGINLKQAHRIAAFLKDMNDQKLLLH
ncbi:DegT/DnrJ/EryC1/StrS family aminotransferase [Candidatus Amoebophilus asiaticus]|nr:DegT/DnrJ/EryC1/StrS family aminotransferase [Candidatus Amoebophilus asiaticus]